MAGIGPPPKDPSQRRRRNPAVAMTPLPAEGRKGPPPAWPLEPPRDARNRIRKRDEERELALWREIWRTPQAVMWARMKWTHEVAQYVRWRVHAERGSIEAAKEARQLGDRLGLSPLALLRLRWEITDKSNTGQPAGPTAEVRQLRAVD
ncbi:MAG TPA: hypothetical protein VMU51_34190 [Mycobacteriales bacterium]|nr:hypothetical protein [Mycobacteriales bacterium]